MNIARYIFTNPSGRAVIHIPMVMPEELSVLFTTKDHAIKALREYFDAIGYTDD